MSTLGLDIGGANIKAVYFSDDSSDREVLTISVPLPMWECWKELPDALRKISKDFGISPDTRVGVTMTGELADCFSCRREGVSYIANAVDLVFSEQEVLFYKTDGNWCDAESASNVWMLLAASNWHAMAQTSAAYLPDKTGLVIDIGSTTTDIIPIIDDQVLAVGKTDFQRLSNHELIYAGIGRTPVCGLIQTVDVDGSSVQMARELFATTDDALIWLKLIKEDDNDTNSADHRSRSRTNAYRRLARMVCSDDEETSSIVIDQIALATIAALETLLVEAIQVKIDRHQNKIQTALLLGTGSFLADRILRDQFPSLQSFNFRDFVGKGCSESGPAYAIAYLLQQRATT